jgi:hypothetical protein
MGFSATVQSVRSPHPRHAPVGEHTGVAAATAAHSVLAPHARQLWLFTSQTGLSALLQSESLPHSAQLPADRHTGVFESFSAHSALPLHLLHLLVLRSHAGSSASAQSECLLHATHLPATQAGAVSLVESFAQSSLPEHPRHAFMSGSQKGASSVLHALCVAQ